MSDGEKIVTKYKLLIRLKVVAWWLVDIILILAIIGWGLDLISGLYPYPLVAFALIACAAIILFYFGIPSQKKLLDRDMKKGGLKAKLAKISIDFDYHKKEHKEELLNQYHNNIRKSKESINDDFQK